MRYRWSAALLILLGVLTLHVPSALAHIPATDKTMTVVLHIFPDDQAVAAEPAKLNFEYNDQLGKFTVQKCNCRVAIFDQGRQLFSGLATPNVGNGVYGSSLSYTFNKTGNYEITLTGNPKQTGDFVPFNVYWNIKVKTDPYASPSVKKYLIIGLTLIAVICICVFGAILLF